MIIVSMDHHELIISILLSLVGLFLLLWTKVKAMLMKLRWCKCEICQAYLRRSWTSRFSSLSEWYTHLLRLSPTGTIHVHVMNNTITANPANVEHILKTNFDNYPKGSPFSAILGDFLGRGIFVADGENWRFQRKIASLELGSVSIRSFAYEILSSEIKTRLLPLLDSCTGDDAFHVASKLSAERALVASPWIWRAKRALNVGSEKHLRDAIRKINVLAEDIIAQRKKMGFSGKNDLLSRFMTTMDGDDQYLRDIVISFLLAGRDTVVSALTVFFYLISENPEVESKIREETDRVLGGPGPARDEPEVLGFEKLREMHYLHAALYESLRLFPPVQMDSKFAKDDDVLPDGTPVRKGDKVSYHPYAMGRMETIWGPDCEMFRPERWLRDGLFRPENPYRYPVFQAGVRVCLGKEMALVAMKTVAVSLVRRFDIRLVEPGQRPRFVPGLTATLSGGLPVVVKRRGEC
ncbi:Cytochrome P450 94C1-like protein [Drosera capensis]